MTSFKILLHGKGSKWYPRILSPTKKPELLEGFNKVFLHWEEKDFNFRILSHLMMGFIMVKLTACFFLLCLSPKQSHKSCGERILMFDGHASYNTENWGHWTWLICLEVPVAWELCPISCPGGKVVNFQKTCPNINKQLSTVFLPMLLFKSCSGNWMFLYSQFFPCQSKQKVLYSVSSLVDSILHFCIFSLALAIWTSICL